MLLQIFQDLIKPQWRVVIEGLKLTGGMTVSDLARRVDSSYMAVKQHCEELLKAGYVDRSRVPRTAVGRPEIFYSLSKKAEALFPQAGVDFTLDLLEGAKLLLGENTPDKLLFQYFKKQQDRWEPLVAKCPTLVAKTTKLAALRQKNGCSSRCEADVATFQIEECHNPMQRIFEHYPRAITMELRMIEELLGVRVARRELSGGRSGQPRVVFEVATTGNH